MAKSPGGTKAAAAPDPRTHILESFLSLLGERSFDQIALGDVATRAGVSLSDLRASYGSTFDMLASFVRATDQKVLAGEGDDMDDQPARDRLFDVLMRRLDALAPYKTTRNLLQLPYQQPLPEALIQKLAKERVREVGARTDEAFW